MTKNVTDAELKYPMTKGIEVEYIYSTASRLIHKNRCHLVGVIATPKDDERAYLEIHDGTNTAEPKILKLGCNTGTSNSVIFPDHILMQRGIYVNLGEDLEHCTVLWHPLED